MNKRQAKKARSKCLHPLVDEYNLITMSAEERRKAWADYDAYCQKNYRYKHYRDRYKLKKPFLYFFPVGQEYLNLMQIMRVRKHTVGTAIVIQDMNQLQEIASNGLLPEAAVRMEDNDNTSHALMVL